MTKNYTALTKDIAEYMRELSKEIPEVTQAFQGLAAASTKDGVLDKKAKEFVALGIAIATRCDGCIGFHVKALVKYGASRAELSEVLGMAIYMGGGPSMMYAADALRAYDEFSG